MKIVLVLHSLVSAGWVPQRGVPGEGPFGLVTANVTAWNSAIKWLEEGNDGFDLLCIQEHHVSSKEGLESARAFALSKGRLLYTFDAVDDLLCVDLGGSRNIKKHNHKNSYVSC